MSFVVRDSFKNTSETITYSTLVEYKTYFYGKTNEFYDLISQLNLPNWNRNVYVDIFNNASYEVFDDVTQVYTRVTDWESQEVYDGYRDIIDHVFTLEGFSAYKDSNLDISKTTEFL